MTAACAAASLFVAGVVAVAAHAATVGCRVTYTVGSQWQGGFVADVNVANLGDPVASWTVGWSFGAGQRVSNAWNATVAQNATQVTAQNMSYNGNLGTNAAASFGFQGTWTGSNPVPATFTLNGSTCTGSPSGSPTTPGGGPTSSPPPSTSPPPTGGTLPTSFRWSSSGILISPRPDSSHPIVSVKDPTVVRWNNQWLVYGTTANTAGAWSLFSTSFADWSQAASAPQYFLDRNPNIGTGYRAAPQVFYFAPQNKWYLVYQQGPPAFSTADDPTRPDTWTAPRNFIDTEPAVLLQNKGGGGWLDFWVICDDVNCYLFFTDDNGHLYRAQTTVANFPNGFGNTQLVISDTVGNLFEASATYKVRGANQYLTLIEAFDNTGRRYYRAFTASSLGGSWTSLGLQDNPFAQSGTVTFPGGAWTRDISHGELIRAGYDQKMEINPCNLQLLYQGMDPNASGDYSQLPWRLGLLTQTNPC
jgi:endo-1,4-beta-xylanase